MNVGQNQAMFAGRYPSYHKDFPLILYWTHKCGCTVLNKWFFYQIGLLDQALRYHPWIHRFRERYCSEPDYLANLMKDYQHKESVKLVRNPYTRAVSSFLHAVKTGCCHWPEMIDFYQKNGISFKQFLHYVRHRQQNRSELEWHIHQQCKPEEKAFISRYIYLENLQTELRQLEKQYALKHAPTHQLFQSNHHNVKGNKVIDLAARALNAKHYQERIRPQNPSYRSFYDEENMQLVQEIFQIDFDICNYSKELVI
ncbi:sulfotransferase family 2 domain-containing protein [Hazenella sp. IB182357]|uniref:Sulfotransferase family 2 domain-containing protein n=1 Tax=Polycladospora coralii TaxID=2771432 RepID=A0A926N8Q7_9BACL|nr:sulfotransferase family 2 domain-containing protein [Polycladospora coralii]MBD1371872.1 sulfotransferase family 2 domain-containing protein [Polycladospora coralii]MBS7529333.1 sulfotransferase family 2 domain-containing protein [Polycladospora coralii]